MKIPYWVRRPLHPVYLIAGLCAGVLIGALVSRQLPSEWLTSWTWVIVLGLFIVPLFWRRQWWCVIAIFIVGMLIGYVRGNGEMAGVLQAKKFIGQAVTLRGEVAEDSSTSKSGSTVVRLNDVVINKRHVAGQYWVMLRSESTDIRRSDVVTVRGTLEQGFGTFAAAMYRAELQKSKREALKDLFVEMRDWLSAGISTHLPNPEAALGAGYVLGQKRALPPDFDEALRVVGLTHVVVASGYNLTILVRLARRLFAKVSRYAAAFAGGTMAAMFIGITGMSPSMTRAGMVAGLSLLAWYYGRQVHPVVLLLFAAAISVLIQPSYIWGDVGWMLSFAAFGGVMLLAPVLQVYFYGEKKPGIARQILGETFSAQLLTAPIVIAMFGTFSNVALLANMFVLPLVPLAMLMVFVTGIVSLWLPFVAAIVAMPTYWLLHYMTTVVTVLADSSWASFEAEIGIPIVIASYILIIMVIVYLRRATRFNYRSVNIVD